MKRVLIISYVQSYNRQGYDLAQVLRDHNVPVVLLQQDAGNSDKDWIVGIKWTKPQGPFHKLHVLLNHCRFFLHSFFRRKDVVVSIGRPALLIGGLYKKLFGCTLIYYALEYSNSISRLDRWVLKNLVDKYIDVEENRLRQALSDVGKSLPAIVIHNMPRLHTKRFAGGYLRSYLADQYNVEKDVKIAVYAGSYQTYACLDKVVQAADLLPEGYLVVLMSFGLPGGLVNKSKRCVIIPPIRGEEFYNWLTDADCSLLPYESTDDFNVQNCSPQKIFDCYLSGVPFVASNRPIIRETLETEPSAGMLCGFTNPMEIAAAIQAVSTRHDEVRDLMINLHRAIFNYDHRGNEIIRFILGSACA